MPGGGTLGIGTDDVTSTAATPAGSSACARASTSCMRVQDTGAGMDESVQAQVFEPYFTTKPVGKGTGLGLSTVFGIVQQSGGQIELTSAPGEGTTVEVYLPVPHERDGTQPAPCPRRTHHAPRRRARCCSWRTTRRCGS